jgi:D-alanyl-lipoteichoic acid acyltransferase DltB (MBOAT superfamily)
VGFFLVVYAGYLLLGRSPTGYKLQNLWLLAASYFFYGYWDWRFCLLLGTTTAIQFTLARLIYATEDPAKRKALLVLAVTTSLTVLGFFKYFNFFANSLADMLEPLRVHLSHTTLHIILPVGMSFYTFKEISYVADVYRHKQQPAKSFFDFALYVSFFPQLVAGPIERAGEMLPQIGKPRVITAEKFDAGLYLILWGFFKKLVIADNLRTVSDTVFNGYRSHHGLDTVIGIVAYAVVIYCDFSGYTDIARGLARLMGFELPLNFKLPYFAQSPSDFWSRWHVTLSQWLRDYLYISLGGNRVSETKIYRNLMITMVLGGLWHGAAWNFVAWGAYHGLLLCIYRAWTKVFPPVANPGNLRIAGRIALMFCLTLVGWVFFRAGSLDQIVTMLTSVGVGTSAETRSFAPKLLAFGVPLVVVQTFQAQTLNLLIPMWMRVPARIAWQTSLLLALILIGAREATEFIYFQF